MASRARSGRPPRSRRLLSSAALAVLCLAGAARGAPLPLAELDRLALADEAGVTALEARARAARERAVADAQLPDPVLSVGALNFPVDTFAFDRERMTQLQLGLRQQFPGGDTLDRRRARGEALAEGHEAASGLRRRQVLRAAREAWLTVLWRREERALLEAEAPRLRILEETALAGYREGAGSQQDVLRARLERDALEERLLRNGEALDVARAELARWIGEAALAAEPVAPPGGSSLDPAPLLALDAEGVRARLAAHPVILARRARIDEAEADVGLARADYRPDWALEVGYGLRDELSPVGDTPDFLSAVVSVELPLFPDRRQDRRLAAARAEHESARAERIDALRELERDWRTLQARHARLEARRRLQAETIEPRTAQSARAALEAYRADAGDFPEVVRAVLAGLDVRLELVRLEHELRRVAAELAWLLAPDPEHGAANGT
ncbi:MAG: TolC family protein, partial [Pseudomonadales bacterium]|nr:TolC family protein [Pseudomonadales bacterium]